MLDFSKAPPRSQQIGEGHQHDVFESVISKLLDAVNLCFLASLEKSGGEWEVDPVVVKYDDLFPKTSNDSQGKVVEGRPISIRD